MNRSDSLHLETSGRSVARVKPRYKQTPLWQWARTNWIGESVRAIRKCGHELSAWKQLQPVPAPDIAQLTKSLAILSAQASDGISDNTEADAPIFLLSIGWRAGSTLLQRILASDPRLLLWGEPLGEMTVVTRMVEMIRDFISPRNLELWMHQQDPAEASLTTSWVANLYPAGNDFRAGLRSIFDRWLAQPARQHGFFRWGLKEVRLGASEAILLHWLYPNAKFLVISRHPYDCYRSLSDSGWNEVYFQYPDAPVDSAARFAWHWNRLAMSWSEVPAGFPFIQLKYEDLVQGNVDFRKLESWLGLEIKESAALSISVGSTTTRSQLSWYERMIISREANAGMRAVGYSKGPLQKK
jgi:hypothetical protein